MSYLKLCQIVQQTETEVLYLEDSVGKKSRNSVKFPATILCEIIDWGTLSNYVNRGKFVSLDSIEVELPNSVTNVRDAVYSQLIASYPELVI